MKQTPTDSAPRLSVEHQANVLAALDKIETAQNLINAAALDLSPINGFGDEWSAAAPVYDAVSAYWYRVEARLSSLREKGIS